MSGIEWRLEERDCPICGEARGTSLRLGRRGGAAHRLGLGRETGVARCRRCHAVYQLPTALPERNPYLEHAAEDYFKRHNASRKVALGEQLAQRAHRLTGLKGRLLEIGCGRGELLRGAANAGWIVRGVEMTETFARVAAQEFGVPVEVSPVETASGLREEWDAVFLAAVLEHLYEPMAVLSRVREALRPGGVIFIDVPNECSFHTRLGNAYLRATGRDWAINLSPTFPPFHVVGFCPASLKWALHSAGLSVITLQLYKTQSCLSAAGAGAKARIEQIGLQGSLAVGHMLGMGAGILCWARRT